MLSRNRRNERRKTHLRSCLQPRKRLSLCLPLQGSGDILFFPLRTSLGLSVCVSVYLSVTKSCPLYNLITVTDISTKLHTFVNHNRRRVGGRTGLMVRASDSGSGDPGSILGRVGVFVSLSKRHLLPKSTGNTQE